MPHSHDIMVSLRCCWDYQRASRAFGMFRFECWMDRLVEWAPPAFWNTRHRGGASSPLLGWQALPMPLIASGQSLRIQSRRESHSSFPMGRRLCQTLKHSAKELGKSLKLVGLNDGIRICKTLPASSHCVCTYSSPIDTPEMPSVERIRIAPHICKQCLVYNFGLSWRSHRMLAKSDIPVLLVP